MVLPSLFSKSSKKSKINDVPNFAARSAPTSNPGTPPSSPEKGSHSRLKNGERRSSSYSSKRSSKYDEHPLNLPPEERQRLASSTMSAMSDQPTPQPMDIDREVSSSPVPSSPATQEPKTNGVKIDRPAPPPHRYTKSPPPQSANYATTTEAATPVEMPTFDAEEYKAAGNKFFKIKDYTAAIKEYSKGMLSVLD